MLRYLSEFLQGELSLIDRFCRDRRGNIAIITAAALIPLLGFVGAAIDYGSATQARTSLQNALDAASLAVNKAGLDPSISDGQLQQIAQDTIAANYKLATNYTLTTFDVDRAAGRVQLAATSQVPTNLIGIMGFDTIDFNSVAESVIGSQSLEIVMVLDNSGSMSGSKISDLRTAAKNLTNTMFASQAGSNILSVKMGIVPFAGLVNVGANNAGAA
jgi:Flp pilus assembly protein TadG